MQARGRLAARGKPDADWGERLWLAREVLGLFLQRMQDGSVGRMTPSPSYRIAPEEVARRIRKIDARWDREAAARTRLGASDRDTYGPDFEHRLPYAQQVALCEMVDRALYGPLVGARRMVAQWPAIAGERPAAPASPPPPAAPQEHTTFVPEPWE